MTEINLSEGAIKMKKHHHPILRGKAYPVSEPPNHSNWVLVYSGRSDGSSREPFVLARYIPRHSRVRHWQVMHSGHYMGATHWAEVTAFDDIICDRAEGWNKHFAD